MPRLCILTQYFPPEMGAPQARLSELGERLIDLGWEVEALTALPNYPTGRIFDGYTAWRPRLELVGRIRTLRVPLLPSTRGFARRLACYLSFVASASLFAGRLRRPHVLLAESPPLFVGLAARHLAWRWRCPYVFNVSDLWPESALRLGVLRPGAASRAAERLELAFYRHAAGVTGQSEEILASVRARSRGTPTALVTNGVDPERFGRDHADAGARALLGAEAGPVFLYAGLLGHAQGLDQVLDLAAALPPEAAGRAVLVGDGPLRSRLAARLARDGIARVRLLPAVPRDRVPALLAAADVALITLGGVLPGAVPSKIYEAMASELPILLVASGEAARRVAEAGCGLVAAPGDAAALRAAWERLAGDAALRRRLGAAGRRAAETLYDRRAIAQGLDRFLRERLRAA
jgi:glycosyltransferase involved in cell wall biosynthesis